MDRYILTYMQLIIALFMAGKLVKHNLMVKTLLCGVFRDLHGQYHAHRNEKPIPKLQFRIFMNFLSNQNKFQKSCLFIFIVFFTQND